MPQLRLGESRVGPRADGGAGHKAHWQAQEPWLRRRCPSFDGLKRDLPVQAKLQATRSTVLTMYTMYAAQYNRAQIEHKTHFICSVG